jgi:hypothetical protein
MTKEYIYALIDPRIDQVFYVGKTTNPKNRLLEHLGECKIRGSKKDLYLRELLQIGIIPELFIVDECYTEKAFWEIFYIHLFKSWGYDLTNSVFDIQKRKPIVCKGKGGVEIVVLNEDGTYVQEFGSIVETAAQLQFSLKRIQEAIVGKRSMGYGIVKDVLSYKGYVFIKKSEYDPTKDYSVKRRERVVGKIGRVIQQLDLEGNVINEFISGLDASRKTGVDNSSIGRCCDNKSNYIQAGGFKWKYRYL